MEVSEENKKLIQRSGHSTAAVSINSDCMEVILYGGWNNDDMLIGDTVVVRFGECFGSLW